MKKYIGLCVLSLLLFGCSATSEDQIKKQVDNILSQQVSDVEIAAINYSKPYYSYYLPTDVKISESNELSSVLNKDGFKIILNFTPSAIIISEYYVNFDEEKDLEIEFKNYTEENLKSLIQDERLRLQTHNAEKADKEVDLKETIDYTPTFSKQANQMLYSGQYEGKNNTPYYYQLRLIKVNDTYYIHFDGTLLTLTSIVPATEVDDIVYRMLVIAKSINYDKEKILKDYSLQYELEKMEQRFQEQHDYINRNLPSEGYLEDLLNQEEWNFN